jgi:hypothetical protein
LKVEQLRQNGCITFTIFGYASQKIEKRTKCSLRVIIQLNDMVVNIQNSGVEADLNAVFESYGFFLNIGCYFLLKWPAIAAVLEDGF